MKRPPIIIVQLVHIQGPFKGEIQEFSEPGISIGRHLSCQLRFPADLTSISRKHAEIVREGNQFKLVDHSANGTFVNGKKIKEVYLKNGDVLAFSEGGPKVSFLTQVREGEEEAESPIPREELKAQLQAESPKIEPKFVPKVEPQRTSEEKPRTVQPAREEPGEVSVQNVKIPLIIQYGPTLRSFKELPVTIGRSPKCEFTLDHPQIFDQHAMIFFSQNQYWVKDLTGQRLVQINRQPIAFQTLLKPNDDLALSPKGPVFRFLGEGRLLEVTGPSTEESSEKKGEAYREIQKEKKPKGLKSVFKKLLDR
ncbi:MAG: hypothetical protein COS40_05465 [Deltaproteobacteria bacterium CG03_land_8_20_14_0_80_45_14]|nr:MAG: hypothetical protein COS40_05465 [Deltaproteobacteria bacterium CG03_land_8_20_14_0_80_45_14]